MTILTADDLAGKHRYLARARPDWSMSMGAILNRGGPWECQRNGCGPSYLCYRCSICGRDLCGSGGTAGRQE